MESGAGLKTQRRPLIIIKTTRGAAAAAAAAVTAAANCCRSCVRLNFSAVTRCSWRPPLAEIRHSRVNKPASRCGFRCVNYKRRPPPTPPPTITRARWS